MRNLLFVIISKAVLVFKIRFIAFIRTVFVLKQNCS